jgi:transporter family protein
MNYLLWALLAMLGYTFVAPLMKVALGDMPSNVVLLISNSMLVLSVGIVVAVTESEALTYFSHPKIGYVVAGGVFLTVGIYAYYQALDTGPVSVVVPIFAMFIVTSSVIGILFFDEALSIQKGVGIALSMVAIYLVASG